MATLLTIRQTTIDTIADLLANPKPSYTVKARSISWGSYLDMLYSSLAKLDAAIENEQDMNPFFLTTQHSL